MIRQVIVQDGGDRFIRDWFTWEQPSGVSRTWSRNNWWGLAGKLFRDAHIEISSHMGGIITFWQEIE